MTEEEPPATGRHRIVAVAAGIGLPAGVAVPGVMVTPRGGYLSVTAAGRDTAGSEISRQERPIDPYSLRGIGTADGGYLIAGRVVA